MLELWELQVQVPIQLGKYQGSKTTRSRFVLSLKHLVHFVERYGVSDHAGSMEVFFVDPRLTNE